MNAKTKTALIILLAVLIGLVSSSLILMEIITSSRVSRTVENSLNADRVQVNYQIRVNYAHGDKREVVNGDDSTYYAKTEDGYDMVTNKFSVFDNVIYLNFMKVKAQITSEENKEIFDTYFKNLEEDLGYGVLKILDDSLLFSVRQDKKDNVSSYKVRGVNVKHYDSLISSANDLKHIRSEPILIETKDDKVSEIVFRFSFYTFERFSAEIKIQYDYDKILTPTVEQESMKESSFKNVEFNTVEKRTFNYSKILKNGIDGKIFYISYDYSDSTSIVAYDVKEQKVAGWLVLPKKTNNFGASHFFETKDAMYACLLDFKQIVKFTYADQKTETYQYDEFVKICAMIGDKYLVRIQEDYYFSDDLVSFTKATEFNKYLESGFYSYKGNTYATRINQSTQNVLVKLDANGNECAELAISSYDSFFFTSQGLIAKEGTSIIYRFNENLVLESTFNTNGKDIGFIGENDKFIMFTSCIYDKEQGVYHPYTKPILGFALYYDGLFYFANEKEIFAFDDYEVIRTFSLDLII